MSFVSPRRRARSIRRAVEQFFDHFFKREDNGWEQTPRVLYSVLNLEGGDQVNVPADQFPPTDVASTKYYPHGRSRTLATTEAGAETTAG
ncbi:hypothetical protein AB0F03_22335 [Streptomyces sp. NPDC028722]|uniref:hypothetical protein n=1 Tax=Streptomyces sp. NPDC028722 TaxID=3155016 RepID=UPI0033D72D02